MSYYSKNSEFLIEQYNQIDSEEVHANWLSYLPNKPGLACDIGAGSGRDANWLAGKGWTVLAVEPEGNFRNTVSDNCHPNVQWLDDKLPEISKLTELNQSYDFILLSAVWMDLNAGVRERAFRKITDLLKPGGILVISLKHGDQNMQARNQYPVSVEELRRFASDRAIDILDVVQHPDKLQRDNISWETVVISLPDDGTGNLPLLRHIIVNDSKSGTNKLGLLRTLLRIADGAPGMVIQQTDDWVEIPFGLVGLYWIKLYWPLVDNTKIRLAPQHKPSESRGLGFAKPQHFYKMIENLSMHDLRVGTTIDKERAHLVIASIKDACENIQKMPANYITYPWGGNQIFEFERHTFSNHIDSAWRIDMENLKAFGKFKIPFKLWKCLGQYACWIEPALLNELERLITSWNDKKSLVDYNKLFQWEDSTRETSRVRKIANNILQNPIDSSQTLTCTWSGKKLSNQSFDIDHCFPWSRWYNNDLWNLLPTTSDINNRKRDKLPTASLMMNSKGRILNWWKEAFTEDKLKPQFMSEASSSLPLVNETSSFDDVFRAVMIQRVRLRQDQRLVEWEP